MTAHGTEPADPRVGPEDAAPELHADETRAGSPPAEVDPGVVPTHGTSEEAEPVRGLHVPDIDEDGPIAPGRYRTEARAPRPSSGRRTPDTPGLTRPPDPSDSAHAGPDAAGP